MSRGWLGALRAWRRKLPSLPARFHIACGLSALLGSVVLVAGYAGFVPDRERMRLESRMTLVETLGTASSALLRGEMSAASAICSSSRSSAMTICSGSCCDATATVRSCLSESRASAFPGLVPTRAPAQTR